MKMKPTKRSNMRRTKLDLPNVSTYYISIIHLCQEASSLPPLPTVQSKVQSKVQPPVMSAPPAASQVAGGSAQPQHVRVLRTESKVGTRQLQVNFITQHFICTSTVDSKLQIGQTWVGWVSEQILSLNSQHSVVLYFTCGCVEC